VKLIKKMSHPGYKSGKLTMRKGKWHVGITYPKHLQAKKGGKAAELTPQGWQKSSTKYRSTGTADWNEANRNFKEVEQKIYADFAKLEKEEHPVCVAANALELKLYGKVRTPSDKWFEVSSRFKVYRELVNAVRVKTQEILSITPTADPTGSWRNDVTFSDDVLSDDEAKEVALQKKKEIDAFAFKEIDAFAFSDDVLNLCETQLPDYMFEQVALQQLGIAFDKIKLSDPSYQSGEVKPILDLYWVFEIEFEKHTETSFAPTFAPKGVPFNEIAKSFFENSLITNAKSRKSDLVKVAVFDSFMPYAGINEITSKDGYAYMDWLLANPDLGVRSNSTIVSYLAPINRILKWAKRKQMLTIHPWSDVSPEGMGIKGVKGRPYEPYQLQQLFNYTIETDFRAIFCILLGTGARYDEIASLRWEWITYDQGFHYIDLDGPTVPTWKYLKGVSRRKIPLSEWVWKKFPERKAKGQVWNFPMVYEKDSSGNPMLVGGEQPWRISTAIEKRMLRRINSAVDDKRLGIHSLRHTNARMLREERNVSDAVIAHIHGRSLKGVTFRYGGVSHIQFMYDHLNALNFSFLDLNRIEDQRNPNGYTSGAI